MNEIHETAYTKASIPEIRPWAPLYIENGIEPLRFFSATDFTLDLSPTA